MSTLTAICASPPLPNPGMASVDLALYFLVKNYFPTTNIEFNFLYFPHERNPELSSEKIKKFKSWHSIPFKYKSCRDNFEEIYKSNAIVYWGDFLHSREYLYQMAYICQQIGLTVSFEDALELVLRSFYLKNAPDNVIRRTLSFGGTLIFNRVRDYQDRQYYSNLWKLFSNSKGTWMRDIYSCAKVNKITYNNNRKGVDCALLLRDQDILLLPRSDFFNQRRNEKIAGVFFCRSHTFNKEIVLFIKELCARLEVNAEWFPWFPSFILPNYLPDFLDSFPEMESNISGSFPKLGDLLLRLSQYNFVITDTYHVCLNAWRYGIPAICIGEVFSNEAHDISNGWKFSWRDKRQTFYFMHDAMDFYVHREEILSSKEKDARLNHIADIVRDKQVISSIFNDIKRQADIASEDFIRELKYLL